MPRNQRIGLIVAAVVFAVIAFIVARPGGDDEGESAGQTSPTAQTSTQAESETNTDATEEPHETVPAETKAVRIQIRGGEVVGGAADVKVKKGDAVQIVVSSDVADELHLHGYDIEKEVAAGESVDFKFTADVEGIFEMESHEAEDAGRDPLVAKLTVEPG